MHFIQGAAVLASALLSTSVQSAALAPYAWKQVKIGGGGGFIPGVVFNPTEKGLTYLRTDIGGAYRLNADDSWAPITEFVADGNWNQWGIDAIATDPIDTNRLYLAVGMYSISWDPYLGSILRSTDKGATWKSSPLPFKVGGNMPGRGAGERLAIDPNKNNILFFGARSGNGLWKSTDFGATWAKVTTFKWPGTFYQSEENEYTKDIIGLAWVTFDKTSSVKGTATPRIFVGVVDKGQSVFKSEDGGATWSWVSGEPQQGFIPHKGVLSPAEKVLYISYANGAGPYDGTNGTVHKYNIATGAWTDISPVKPAADSYFGYGGLTVDLQKPGTLMVAALNQWWPDATIWRSLNSGATWSPIWEFTSYPTRAKYYSYDITNAPWLQDKTNTDEFKAEIGWMIESLEIDPHDSNHWLYGTGATLYGGRDLLKWDTVHNVTVKSLANGIEETSVAGLICPPGGPALLSVTLDIGGFVHNNLDVGPAQAFQSPTYGSTVDIDYAGNKPANLVRAGAHETLPQVSLSQNFGTSWSANYAAAQTIKPGKVAISADGDTIFLQSASAGSLVSKNSGTFTAVPSLPSGSVITSDKRNNTVFYGGSAGGFYLSTNGGTSFTKTTTLGSSTAVNEITVHPLLAGDVWASTDTGLFHSTNYGITFSQVSGGVTAGWSFALGAGATASAYPVIYGFFKVDGVINAFKSEDKGANWFGINGPARGFGAGSANVVGADITKYGRVYIGTNGRGIFVGNPSGTTPPVSTTPGATSSSSTKPGTTPITTVRTTAVVTTSMRPITTTTRIRTTTPLTTRATTTTSAAGTGATSTPYGQCGGSNYTGPTICPTGWKCIVSNPFYSQCLQ